MAASARFTSQIAFVMTPSAREQIDLIAEGEAKSIGQVARELIDEALVGRQK